MNKDIIERYIYAVSKQLPRRLRADVEKELHGLVEDMLEERCAGTLPQENDIRQVLDELGPPWQLAAKYDPAGERGLIDPPYYTAYKSVLAVVAAIVLAVSGVVSVINAVFGTPQFGFLWLAETLWSLVRGAIGAFAMVTAVFAFLSYKKIPLDRVYSDLDDLPPVPQKHEAISRTESVVGIVFSVLFTALLLGLPSFFAVNITMEGRHFPIFNMVFLRENWVIILLIAVLGIADEIVQLIEGRYNKRVAVSAIVTGVPTIGLLVFLLAENRIFSAEFVQFFYGLSAETGILGVWVDYLPRVVLAVVACGILISIGVTVYRAWKYRERV